MYGKIFEEIYMGTLMANEGWLGVYVFTGMVVLADERGVIPYDDRMLYRLLGLESDPRIDFAEFLECIKKMCAPDKLSNLKDHDGKRIIHLSLVDFHEGDRGYWIVNYQHYRDKGSRAEREAYQHQYYENVTKKKRQEKRKKKGKVSTSVNKCQHESTDSIHTDTDTDINTLSRKHDIAVEILEYLNQKAGKKYQPVKSNLRFITARLEEFKPDEIKKMIDAKVREWSSDDKWAKYLRPKTLFNATNCANYIGDLESDVQPFMDEYE